MNNVGVLTFPLFYDITDMYVEWVHGVSSVRMRVSASQKCWSLNFFGSGRGGVVVMRVLLTSF